MPLYEYHCKSCDRVFEVLRSVALRNDAAPCPQCNSTARVFQVMTGFARIATHTRWRPASPAEQLAGHGVSGPGVPKLGRTSSGVRETILHACSGNTCAYCS
ncbi:MAG: zinc ribbon domain-containing protein [Burkholderiales bacterium]